MKPSCLFVVAIAITLVTLCTSFSSGKGASPSNVWSGSSKVSFAPTVSFTPTVSPSPAAWIAVSPSPVKDNTHYYWYLSGELYDGWYTIAQEIGRLQAMYGVFVDLSPSSGGTLLSRGYILYGVPHLIWPSANCYGHF